jgi:hypothetical protein
MEANEETIPATQDYLDVDINDENTMDADSPTKNSASASHSNVWGLLRRRGTQEEYRLVHREKDGKKDTYVLGRSKACDILVDDRRVSSKHCSIYCDYSQARMRVMIEDSSANGTYINDSLMKLTRERLTLKSGDEIFLMNPRNLEHNPSDPEISMCSFMFINYRDRLIVERRPTTAGVSIEPNLPQQLPSQPASQQSQAQSQSISQTLRQQRHVEDYYIIGDQIGSGMCGQVHLCRDRFSGELCAVKIIDTRKFVLSPGLSPRELREEATMMRSLSHVSYQIVFPLLLCLGLPCLAICLVLCLVLCVSVYCVLFTALHFI